MNYDVGLGLGWIDGTISINVAEMFAVDLFEKGRGN